MRSTTSRQWMARSALFVMLVCAVTDFEAQRGGGRGGGGGYTYYQCGSTWYQPVHQGSQVTYVVVNPPQ